MASMRCQNVDWVLLTNSIRPTPFALPDPYRPIRTAQSVVTIRIDTDYPGCHLATFPLLAPYPVSIDLPDQADYDSGANHRDSVVRPFRNAGK